MTLKSGVIQSPCTHNGCNAGCKQNTCLVLGKRVAHVCGTAAVQTQSIGRYLSSSNFFLMLKVVYVKLKLKNQPIGEKCQ